MEEKRSLPILRWGQKFNRSYESNNKKFRIDVKTVIKIGSLRMEETVKDVNGRMLKGNGVRKRWEHYFEKLFNVEKYRGQI